MIKTDSAVALGLEAIRYLSQTAEAYSLYALEQGHDGELVTISVHCSDRAEHVAQYFLEAPDTSWPLDSVLDDLAWLSEIEQVTDRVRRKVMRDIPSSEDLAELATRIKAYLEADSDAETEAPATGANSHPLFNLPANVISPNGFISPNGDVKPYTLGEMATGHMVIVGNPPKPDSHYQSLSESFFALNKRDFASLSQLEVMRFWALKHAGSRFGLMVDVCVIDDSEDIQASLVGASPEQQEEIYRSVRTEINVRWAMLDSQPSSAGLRALLGDQE